MVSLHKVNVQMKETRSFIESKNSAVDSIDNLQFEIESPFESVDSIEIKSENEARNIIEQIQSKLDSKCDWSIKKQSIQQAISLLKGNVHYFPGCDMTSLARGISLCVTDLRSSLVKWGCMFVSAASKKLRTDFVSSIEILIPALSKPLTHGTSIINLSCRYAIHQISQNVMHRRVVKALMSMTTSKSQVHRLVVTECFKIIINKWEERVLVGLREEIIATLNKLKSDASAEVRQLSKEALGEVLSPPTEPKEFTITEEFPDITIKIPKTPKSMIPTPKKTKPKTPRDQNLSNTISFTIPKNLTPMKSSDKRIHSSETPNRSPPKTVKIPEAQSETEDISNFMPPSSLETTNYIISEFGKIIINNNFDKLQYLEDLLPPTIRAGSQYVKDLWTWEPVLRGFMKQYNDVFLEQIREILEPFCFSNDLLTIVFDYYSPDSVINSCINYYKVHNQMNNHFIVLISSFIRYGAVFDLNQEILSFLTSAMRNKKADEHHERIKKYISNVEIGVDSVFDDLCDCIRNRNDFSSLLSKIRTTLKRDTSFFGVVNRFIQQSLPELISDESRETKRNAIEVTIQFLGFDQPFDYVPVFECLIENIGIAEKSIKDRINDCIPAILSQSSIVDYLIEHLNQIHDENDCINYLSFLHRSFVQCPPNKLFSYLSLTYSILSRLIVSECTSIRRLVISIFVEFQIKTPKDFAPYLSQLSPTNQKLIQLRCSKSNYK